MRKRIFILVCGIMVCTSCGTVTKVQSYKCYETFFDSTSYHQPSSKAIDLKNDSVLMYSERFGGLGNMAEFKYKFINNELSIDSVDIYGYKKNSLNRFFLYTKDSLVNKKTGEIYYNQKGIDKKIKKLKHNR